MRIIVVTIILALCAPAAAAAEHYVLRNSSVNVVVDLGTGAIAEFHDLHTPDSTMIFHSNESVLQIAAGDMGPVEFKVIGNGPDFVTLESPSFHGSGSSIPLLTTITYRMSVLANARHIVRLPASLGNLCSAEAPPSKFVLAQNYPNPFNGGTAISYDLPRSTRVKLVIYNVAGESIAVLLDREQPPGSYTVAWDGLDRAGRRAASGVYFYRLQTGYTSSVRKLVLLR